MATYPMHVAGLDRDLPICKVTDDLYIGAFIMFGDAELTVCCAQELLKLAAGIDYDYLFTAEAKSIPLIHEMARQSGAKKYFIARKGPKVYMPDPISVDDKSITTVAEQKLFLGSDDAALIRGKKVLLVDDVISTGGSLKAMEALVEKAGGTVAGRMAVLAEGGAAERKDILFLENGEEAPADGKVLEAVNLQIDKDGTVLVRETRKVDGREQVQTAKLAVQFFRVGDGVYVDAILKEMPDSRLEKSIAALMLFPVHALAKVEFHGDTLQLRYPSPDLGKALKDRKLPPVMTFTTFDEEIEDEDGVAVFTATGEAWEDVLQNMPATVFGDSDKEVVAFKRVVVK